MSGIDKTVTTLQGKKLLFKGITARNFLNSSAGIIECRLNYNGSGDKAFGGAKCWPTVQVHLALPEDSTDEIINKIMKDFSSVIEKYTK